MKRLLILATPILAVILAVAVVCSRAASGWAEITLLSAQQMPDGRVRVNFIGGHSHGGEYKFTFYRDGAYVGATAADYN